MDNEELQFILKMRDEASAILKRFNDSVNNTGQSTDTAGKKMKGMAASMDEIAQTAVQAAGAIAGVYAATRSFQSGARAFSTVQDGMVGIQATTNMATEELLKFQRTFEKISSKSSTSIADRLGIGELGGRLGVRGGDALNKFITTVGDLSKATGIAADEVGTSLAQIKNVFGETFSTIDRTGSVFTQLTNTTGATADSILRMAREVSLNTAQFKIGSASALGLAAAMSQMGIQAELGGSNIGRVFQTMSKAVQEGGEQLSIFANLTSMTTEEFSALQKSDPLQAFFKFSQGLGQIVRQGGNYQSVLKGLKLDQVEFLKTIIPIVSQYEILQQKVKEATDAEAANSALRDEMARRNATMTAATQNLTNAWTLFKAEVFEPLEPYIVASLKAITEALDATREYLANSSEGFRTFAAVAAYVVPIITAGAFALATVVKVLGILAPMIPGVTASLGLMGAALAAIGGPITLVVAGVAALVVGLGYLNRTVPESERFRTFHEESMERLTEAYRKFREEGTLSVATLKNIAAQELHNARASLAMAQQRLEAKRIEALAYEKELSPVAKDLGFATSKNPNLPSGQLLEQQELVRQLEKQLLELTGQSFSIDVDLAQDNVTKNVTEIWEKMKAKFYELQSTNPLYIDFKLAGDSVESTIPSIKKQLDFDKEFKNLIQLTKASDAELKNLGITREQAMALPDRFKENFDLSDPINSTIKSMQDELTVLGADKNQRAALKAQMDIETQARRAGIDLLDEEARARVETAKAMASQLEYQKKLSEFNDSSDSAIRALNLDTQVQGIADPQARERASAIAQQMLQAEGLSAEDARKKIQEYTAAWDANNRAKQQATFNDSQTDSLRDLQKEVMLSGYYGENRERQAKLIEVAMEAQKAGITDVNGVLQKYIELWKQVDAQQQGMVGALNGVNSGLQSFVSEAQNSMQQFSQITTTALNGFAETTADMLVDGEGDWKGYFDNIAKMAYTFAIKSAMASVISGSGIMGAPNSPGAIQGAQQLMGFQLGSSAANPMWVQLAGGMPVPGVTPGATTSGGGITGWFQSLFSKTPAVAPASVANNFVPAASNTVSAASSTVAGLKTDIVADVLKAGQTPALNGVRPTLPTGTVDGLKNLNGVNPQLQSWMNDAALKYEASTNYDVRTVSGYRPGDPRYHGKGMAEDMALYDRTTGAKLDNYQDPSTFRAYEQYAQQVKTSQMSMNPEMSQDLRWGGYFSGKNNYGAMDTMHFDTAGRRTGMGGGSWEDGLTDKQRALWPTAESQGMGKIETPQIDTESVTNSIKQMNTTLGETTSKTTSFADNLKQVQQSSSQATSNLGQLDTKLTNAVPSVQGLNTQVAAVPAAASTATSGLGSFTSGLSNMFSSMGGPTGIFSIFAGLFHEGGVVGQGGGQMRMVSASGWGGAPRFHSGGGKGVKQSEYRAILKKNERVLTEEDDKRTMQVLNAKASGGGGGGGNMTFAPNTTISVNAGNMNKDDSEQFAGKISKQVDQAIEQRMNEFAQKNMRSGGMFNKGRLT